MASQSRSFLYILNCSATEAEGDRGLLVAPSCFPDATTSPSASSVESSAVLLLPDALHNGIWPPLSTNSLASLLCF